MTKLIKGVNDLATVNPELAKQWHPTKNGDLKPTDVTVNSNKKVWWLLPYDDPVTGKHFDFEWNAVISSRNTGIGCPYLVGQAVWPGFNDLATVNPKLAKEWHPIKNGNLKPKNITANSGKKVWWLLPYDDPVTDKHFDFEWQAQVKSRNKGIGCPCFNGKLVYQGFNDLATVNPELAKEWHPTKNGELVPKNVCANSGIKVWWLYTYDDPKTGKHFDFEWQATVSDRNHGNNCPYLTGHAVWPGYNDLATVNPELAKQWHPIKNGTLTPQNIVADSSKKVWWFLPYTDPKTGKHFNFEWIETVDNRYRKKYGCPFLSNQKIWPGYNDLATTNPELIKEWHPTKNGKLTPQKIGSGSPQKVWWLLPYDDPVTGKHFDFEWKTEARSRVLDFGCPYLSGHAVWPGFNDLATTNPKLAAEWHPTKNGKLTPKDVTAGSNRRVWWIYPYDDPKTGEHFDYEWQATIVNRNKGTSCPYIIVSKITLLIQTFLKNNNINFILEKSFDNLKNKSYLRFDLFIDNKIIEVDGIQHFKFVNYFHKSKNDFKERVYCDNAKNQYCYDNNIPLLRIPYIYDPVADKEKIEKFVLDFITTGEIPQEIIDFYSQYKFSNYTNYIFTNKISETV